MPAERAMTDAEMLRAIADRQAASLLPTGDGALICLSAADATRLRELAETLGRVTPAHIAACRGGASSAPTRWELADLLAALTGGTREGQGQ